MIIIGKVLCIIQVFLNKEFNVLERPGSTCMVSVHLFGVNDAVGYKEDMI
jgi:hypothetical protein